MIFTLKFSWKCILLLTAKHSNWFFLVMPRRSEPRAANTPGKHSSTGLSPPAIQTWFLPSLVSVFGWPLLMTTTSQKTAWRTQLPTLPCPRWSGLGYHERHLRTLKLCGRPQTGSSGQHGVPAIPRSRSSPGPGPPRLSAHWVLHVRGQSLSTPSLHT